MKLLLLSSLWLVAVPPVHSQDVLTYHNDNARTGQNLNETILTPSNVNVNSFGRLFTLAVDGKVDAQPLYVSAVPIPGNGTRNLLVVGTEHDSVYAFDTDTGAVIWKVSTLNPGETTSDPHGCGQVVPEIGITATPVIDRARRPNGAIYVVAMSKDGSGGYHQRLHALDLTTGAELFAGPKEVEATFPGDGDNSSGGKVIFDPGQYKERAALLLLNSIVYTAWSSHCDFRPYTGWIIGYSASTLARKSVLNVTPNGNQGAIWMSGAGPAADSLGNIYLLDANGTFDAKLNASGFPSNGDFGNAFLKLSTAGRLTVADYFEMDNQLAGNGADDDLGSGGALVLPDMTDKLGQVRHLAVGAGKDQNLYLVDRDSMGKFSPSRNKVYQELPGVLFGGVWSMPAYFNDQIYYGPVANAVLAFQFSNAKLSTNPVSETNNNFAYPGATPSVSANQNIDGIIWAAENNDPAVLHAYDASDLSHELYNSSQAPGGRDQFGSGNKFITPTIANGKVYVGTTNSVGVFGLLPPGEASFFPAKISFAPQLVNTTSAARNLTLTNTGGASLTISSITTSGNFAQTNTCGAVLIGNGKCTITVAFTPSVSGAIAGVITVVDSASNSPQVIALAGTVVNDFSVFPTGLNFGSVAVGATSAPMVVTLTNNQATSASFSFSASREYEALGSGANPCQTVLAAKSNCSLAVTFSPRQNGAINGAVRVSGASFAALSLNLSGTGMGNSAAPLTFSPATLVFQSQAVGETSAPKTVTVTNRSTSPISISSLIASVNFTAKASGVTPCQGILQAGSKCTFTVTFEPASSGLFKGSVAITDDSALSPQLYNLSGNAVLPVSFSPQRLTFPPTQVGNASSPQIVTLTNNQSTSLTINSVAASGQYAAVPGGATACAGTLAPLAQCTLDVTFTPSATGTIPGVLTLTHSAKGSPQELKLTGTGQ